MLVGGLVGLRQGWRRQAVDAGGCLAALALAWWQYPRLLPYVRVMWSGPAARQVALVYLFVVLYGLLRVLMSQHLPERCNPDTKSWGAGLIGAGQAGALALLAVVFLPHV